MVTKLSALPHRPKSSATAGEAVMKKNFGDGIIGTEAGVARRFRAPNRMDWVTRVSGLGAGGELGEKKMRKLKKDAGREGGHLAE